MSSNIKKDKLILDLERGKIMLRDSLPIEKGFKSYKIVKKATDNSNKKSSKIQKPLVPKPKSKSKKRQHKGITYFEFIPYDGNYPTPLSSISSTTNDISRTNKMKRYKEISNKSDKTDNSFGQFVDIENSQSSTNSSKGKGISKIKNKSKRKTKRKSRKERK
jgi:hypothetical protein